MRILLSSLRRADMILVMDQGPIVEQGMHDELLAKKVRTTKSTSFNSRTWKRCGGVDTDSLSSFAINFP